MFNEITLLGRKMFCTLVRTQHEICFRANRLYASTQFMGLSLGSRAAAVVSVCAIAVAFAGCGAGGKLPDKSSKEYAETVSAFYTGLAALQIGDDVTAESKLAQVTQLAPGEPAGGATWGVLAFRQRNFDVA